ncbi:MAG: FAD-dependent thymidylate synthase [Chloroflexi bacterium]|nr:FAD-dependent thymidylate synthase [Chloroflexota bacterium]
MSEPLHIDILDHGFVELIDFMGDDRRCANAARVSVRGDTRERSDKADQGLIARLLADHHTSPFEHAVFQFKVRAPIFVVRQWMRHRFSSFNEESGRYVELVDECYTPAQFRRQVGKRMDYAFENLPPQENSELQAEVQALYRQSYDLYQKMLATGIAREHARMVLPLALYTTFYWTLNALSLMNFLHLRNHEHAQSEIRAYAAVMEDIFKEKMPWTHAAFREHWGTAMI